MLRYLKTHLLYVDSVDSSRHDGSRQSMMAANSKCHAFSKTALCWSQREFMQFPVPCEGCDVHKGAIEGKIRKSS